MPVPWFRLCLFLALPLVACARATSAVDSVAQAVPHTRPSCGVDTTFFEFQVERPAVRRAGPPPPRRLGKDEAWVQFVVAETGRPDSSSFRLAHGRSGPPTRRQHWGAIEDSVAFHAAWRAVAASTFQPAERRGCTVRMLVQEPAAPAPAAGK